MPILPAGLLLAAALSSLSAQAAPDTPSPAAQTPAPPLSSEARGDIFMAEKKYREAIEVYQTGSPQDAVVQNKLGIAYQQTLQLDSARKAYERALKLKPDYMEALNNLGTIYYARKSYRRAINWYNRALKTAPGEARSAPGPPPSTKTWVAHGSTARITRERANACRTLCGWIRTFSNITAAPGRFWKRPASRSAPSIISTRPKCTRSEEHTSE